MKLFSWLDSFCLTDGDTFHTLRLTFPAIGV